jgi:thiol-disulfide isomerase/thioredoxin
MRTNKLLWILLSIFFFITQHVSGQKPIIVQGKFQPEIETTQLSVYRPYAGYFNVFYPDEQSETIIKGSEFKLKLNLDKPGFIRIQSKGMPKTFFYAEPGDTIQIAFMTDTIGVTKTIYSGNNAGANNLLAEKKLLNNGELSKEIILSIFKTGKSADEVYRLLDEEIKKSTLPLQVLLDKGMITKSCYDVMLSETEQKMLSWTNFNPDESVLPQVKLNKDEMKKLAQKLYNHYDPYSDRNLITTTNYSNSLSKSILRKNKIIAVEKPRTQLWAQYENKFGMVASQISSIDYAPDDVQMHFMGKSLLTATVFKPMSDDDYNQVFKTYYNKFPNSPYIPIITAYLAKNKKSMNLEPTKSKFGVYQLGNKNNPLIEQDFIGIDTVTTVQSLIKNYFQGSFVFVDFWATWCSPCIAEFRNEPKLHKFLEDNNIKMLYVSIDNERSMENWKNLIVRYELAGFHYLGNQNVNVNLGKWFQGIPRYMLFDSKGEVKNNNLFRPSKKEELFDQISRLLKE